MKKTHRWYWAILFPLLFLLSQDYFFVKWEIRTGFLGFPVWLSWFMFVHAFFILVFYFFAKRYWK